LKPAADNAFVSRIVFRSHFPGWLLSGCYASHETAFWRDRTQLPTPAFYPAATTNRLHSPAEPPRRAPKKKTLLRYRLSYDL